MKGSEIDLKNVFGMKLNAQSLNLQNYSASSKTNFYQKALKLRVVRDIV